MTNQRLTTIHEMRAKGLSYSVIARLLKISRSTVSYWLNPDQRARRVIWNAAWRKRA